MHLSSQPGTLFVHGRHIFCASRHIFCIVDVLLYSISATTDLKTQSGTSHTPQIVVSSLLGRAEMSKGYLFPELIPNRDVQHRFKVKLTGEGSYKIGGFHCLLPKDRITWDIQYIVHIYYIHIRTVVKEVNKGIRCVNL